MKKVGLTELDLQLPDAAPDALVVVDESGTIVLVNRQAERLFGYSRDEIVGQPVEQLMPEQHQAAHIEHRQHYLSKPVARSMSTGLTLYGRRKNGDEFPVEISLSPVSTVRGTLISSSIRDISKHVEAERILEEARDIAKRSTQAKSRFLAAASHDLRQPLQSMALYLSVLMRRLDDAENTQILTKMSSSVETMGALLDALLDISKLDGGAIEPDVRDAPLQDLLDRIVADNEQQACEKGLELECAATDCVVRTDPALLERIIENFVTNAIRYTEKGRVSIRCECDDDRALLAVSDTGIGIPQDKIGAIFEEYYQLDNPVRHHRKGLGLGLSIAKHIARLLQHELNVVSVPGEGSTFTVEVPLGVPAHQQEVTETQRAVSRDRSHDPVVLFIDDDPAIADACTMLLESARMHVHTALDGDTALEHLADGVRPDVVVSDYRLPGYDGVELMRRIRATIEFELPAVIMTGDTSTREIEDAALPNCTVLHKPVNTDRLIGLIESLTA